MLLYGGGECRAQKKHHTADGVFQFRNLIEYVSVCLVQHAYATHNQRHFMILSYLLILLYNVSSLLRLKHHKIILINKFNN